MGVFDRVTTVETDRAPYEQTQSGIEGIINRVDQAGDQPWRHFQVQGQNLSSRYGQIGGNLTDPLLYGGEGLDFDLVNRIADNPYMTGMIDASLRDPTRQLTEERLPGLAAYGAASGNMGSTLRGKSEMKALRGYEDRAADVGAQMRGQAYSQGLGVAERNLDRGMQSLGLGSQQNQLEQEMQLRKAGMMSDILLPIATNFGSSKVTTIDKGNIEGEIVGRIIEAALGAIGLGEGDGDGDTDGTDNTGLTSAGATTSTTGAVYQDVSGGALDPNITGNIGDYGIGDATGGINVNPQVAAAPPGQVVGQPTVAPGPTSIPEPAAVSTGTPVGGIGPGTTVDPITGQPRTGLERGTTTGQQQPVATTQDPFPATGHRIDDDGKFIPQREVTDDLVGEYMKQAGMQGSAEDAATAREILENSGGSLPSDQYITPTSIADFQSSAADLGITLTDSQIDAVRAANPSWSEESQASEAAADTGGEPLVTPGFGGGNIIDGEFIEGNTLPQEYIDNLESNPIFADDPDLLKKIIERVSNISIPENFQFPHMTQNLQMPKMTFQLGSVGGGMMG